MYFPLENQIQVHQSRVRPCPPEVPAGYYWYGKSKKGPGHPPKWIDQLAPNEGSVSEGDIVDQEQEDPESNAEDCPPTSEDESSTSEDELPDNIDIDSATESSHTFTRAQSTRYGLRKKISPPHRYT